LAGGRGRWILDIALPRRFGARVLVPKWPKPCWLMAWHRISWSPVPPRLLWRIPRPDVFSKNWAFGSSAMGSNTANGWRIIPMHQADLLVYTRVQPSLGSLGGARDRHRGSSQHATLSRTSACRRRPPASAFAPASGRA